MQSKNSQNKDQQRVLLKGYTYKDVIITVSAEGMRLISVSRPKYLDRLIRWSSITEIDSKRCDNKYFMKEYFNWLLQPQDYAGLLPHHRNMITLTFDDMDMMERNVHAQLNVDDDVFQRIQAALGGNAEKAEAAASSA